MLFLVAAAGLISYAGGFTLTYFQDLSPRPAAYIGPDEFRAVLAVMRCQIARLDTNITLKGYGCDTQTKCTRSQYEMNTAYATDHQRSAVTGSSDQTLRLMRLVDGSFTAFFAQSNVFMEPDRLADKAWVSALPLGWDAFFIDD
jgi:hypothetical protein